MNYSKIPKDLRSLRQWGLFRKKWQPERKKYNKFPVDAHNGENAKSNDPSTWTSFDEALIGLEKYQADGLAFFFKAPYIGIDIDHVRDEMEQYIGGDRENIVGDFIDHTNSYTESSISGTGIHIIIKGKMPGDRRRRSNVEIYPDGRFFALTGNVFGSVRDEIHPVSKGNLKYLYKKYLDPDVDKVIPLSKPSNGTIVHLTEPEIFNKIENSAQAGLFQSLMEGYWEQRYTSQSEADQALCNILAFWTAKDRGLMDSIFRKSKLYRPKWDEKRGKQTYGSLTINKAINDTVNVYETTTTPQFNFNFDDDDKPDPMLKSKSYTDVGLRNRFLLTYPHSIIYNGDRKKFLHFTGQRWQYVNDGYISRLLDPVVNNIQKEKLIGEDKLSDKELDKVKKSKTQFIKRGRSNSGKRAAINEVAAYTMQDDQEFDQLIGQINTLSGIVDLSNGRVRDTTYKDLVTKITNAEIQNQPTPIFDSFMQSIFPDYPELIPFIMRLIGYTILGTTAEQKSVFLLGMGSGEQNGSNGKSTLVQLFFNVLGDYAVNIEPKAITSNRSGMSDSSKDNQIADTKGARLIATSELEQGAILSESTLKRLTGNETITAKRLYESPISFMPTGTLWMSSNYMPIIHGMDNGIWRRLIMIPMTAHIKNKDVHLMDELMTEKAGIMRQIIDGAVEYSNVGLKIPDICRQLVGEYRDQMDTVGQFISDCFEQVPDGRVTNKQISSMFETWESENDSGLKLRGLNRELGHRFKRYNTNGSRGFIGLRVKEKSGYKPLEDRIGSQRNGTQH